MVCVYGVLCAARLHFISRRLAFGIGLALPLRVTFRGLTYVRDLEPSNVER
jgi:hypothetical protein